MLGNVQLDDRRLYLSFLSLHCNLAGDVPSHELRNTFLLTLLFLTRRILQLHFVLLVEDAKEVRALLQSRMSSL
jgi:hypothetical protein